MEQNILPITMMVYGDSGVGKTYFFVRGVLEIPELNPSLIIDLEAGTLSVASKVNKIELDDFGKNIVPGKVDSIRIRTWDDLNTLLDLLWSKDNPYKSVILDSITEIDYMSVRKAVSDRSGGGKLKRLMPEIADYGNSSVNMRNTIREFRNLADECGISIFISALAKQEKDDRSGKITIRPTLTGQLTNDIPGLLNITGYYVVDMEDGVRIRVMAFQPDGKFLAKDRTEDSVLGDEIVNPTLSDIWYRINPKSDNKGG